jgi:hypothetical protein
MTLQPSLKIVVEGVTDAQLVRAILGDELARESRFFAAQGRISLATVGRNILVHEGGPVLLVMDSDTLNPQLAAERQALNMVALRGAITSGAPLSIVPALDTMPFKVFTFMPEIEAVFFEAPQALDQLLGKTTPQEKIKEGTFIPKKILAELLGDGKAPRDYQELLSHLDPKSQHALAAGPQARNLKAMVEALLKDAA